MTTTEHRVGDWMTTSTGRKFWPLDPRVEDVELEDIAHALSNVCRFGGRCSSFYSVAQHSVLVAELVEREHPRLALAALLHDAAEAYLGDVIRPIKPFLVVRHEDVTDDGRAVAAHEGFDLVERRVLDAILAALDVGAPCMETQCVIKYADDIALATEARDLMGDPKWPGLLKPCGIRVVPKLPAEAKRAFLDTFARLKAAEAQSS